MPNIADAKSEATLKMDGIESSGYDQLRKILNVFCRIFLEQKPFLKFLHEFDVFVKKYNVSEEHLADYENGILKLKPYVTIALEKGLVDKSLSFNCSVDEMYFSLTHTLLALMEKLAVGGDILSSDQNVESEKQNLVDAIRGIINDKRDYADLRLLQEMCRGERYGVDKFGTIARVEKITNQTLFRYYQELLSTAHLELFYCGSADYERVKGALSRALAPLMRGRVVPPVTAEKCSAPETPREITERMDVTQGKLSMGWRVGTNDASAMMLANLIFGGYSNSKLFLNVREKLSLCYYASSSYHRSKGIVTVSSGIEHGDVETAKREILAQLEAVQRGEFDPWEIEGARSCLIASLESRGDSAGRMEENALGQAATGIRETADELIAALRGVTGERIAAAAQSLTLDTVYFLTGEEDGKDD